jgi:hypothetical protein
MYFVFIYENRRMKPVEVDLRRGRGENVNIIMYPSVQLLYANRIIKNKNFKMVLAKVKLSSKKEIGCGPASQWFGAKIYSVQG